MRFIESHWKRQTVMVVRCSEVEEEEEESKGSEWTTRVALLINCSSATGGNWLPNTAMKERSRLIAIHYWLWMDTRILNWNGTTCGYFDWVVWVYEMMDWCWCRWLEMTGKLESRRGWQVETRRSNFSAQLRHESPINQIGHYAIK